MSQYFNQEADIRRQQAIAQALLESGNIPASRLNQTAGGYVVPVSGWEQANAIASKLLGSYFDYAADKGSKALNAQKDSDAKSQMSSLIDAIGGPSQKANTLPAGADSVSVPNPVTGAQEPVNIQTEQNPRRIALASAIKGMDPQQALPVLQHAALQEGMPPPSITPYQQAQLDQTKQELGLRTQQMSAENKYRDAQISNMTTDNQLAQKKYEEEVRHNKASEPMALLGNPELMEGLKDQAHAIATYRAQLPVGLGRSSKDVRSQELWKLITQENPEFDQTTYGERQKAVKDFATGKQGDQVRSFGVAINHLNQLRGLVDALNNGDIKSFNALAQTWANQTGKPAPTNYDALKTIASSEVNKGLIGGHAAEGDRVRTLGPFDRSNSPKALLGAIDTTVNALGGQVKGLAYQYKRTTKLDNFEDVIGEPTAIDTYRKLVATPAASSKDSTGPVSIKSEADYNALPSGAEYIAPDGSHRKKR